MQRFERLTLRTLDVTAAGGFYASLLGWRVEKGHALDDAGRPVATIAALPESARAKGAPAHWLGHVSVDDLDATRARFVAAGGHPLGPALDPGGGIVAPIRDPFGAVLALDDRPGGASGAVAWHELHTADAGAAWSFYAERFGWHATQTETLAAHGTRYAMFAWTQGAPAVGAMTDAARRPEVHPHWLFHFAVDDVERAAASVGALGGIVAAGPLRLPNGITACWCEDPAGAAFGIARRA